jgi:hypothetical protein
VTLTDDDRARLRTWADTWPNSDLARIILAALDALTAAERERDQARRFLSAEQDAATRAGNANLETGRILGWRYPCSVTDRAGEGGAERDVAIARAELAERDRDNYAAQWTACETTADEFQEERDAAVARAEKSERERDAAEALLRTATAEVERLHGAWSTASAECERLRAVLSTFARHVTVHTKHRSPDCTPSGCSKCAAEALLKGTAPSAPPDGFTERWGARLADSDGNAMGASACVDFVRRLVGDLREVLDVATPAASEPAACTGWTAVWCPAHGDCKCARRYPGGDDTERTLSDDGCPLHASTSQHAASEPARGQPSDEIRAELGGPSDAEQIAAWLERGDWSSFRDFGLQALHDGLGAQAANAIRAGGWRRP